MVQTTIHLPEHVLTYIRQQVETGAFPSEEAVITDALERTMNAVDPWSDPGTVQALAEVERGEVVTVTDIDAFLRGLQNEARENTRRGIPVPEDVTLED